MKHLIDDIKFFAILLAIILGVFAGVNLFLKDEVKFSGRVDLSYRPILDSLHQEGIDSLTFRAHYLNVQNHFKKPFSVESPVGMYIRKDNDIKNYYQEYLDSGYPPYMDLGNYGLGLVYSSLEQDQIAIDFFNKVSMKDAPYFNSSIGKTYMSLGYIHEAVGFFRDEITNKGNIAEAYPFLCEILWRQRDFSSLMNAIEEKPAEVLLASHISIDNEFFNGSFLNYLVKKIQEHIELNLFSFISGLIVFLIWFWYLFKILPEANRKIFYMILMVFLGFIFSFLAFPLYDLYRLRFDFYLDGDLFNDFVFCVFGIGLIEEFVKILPFLLIMFFGNVIKRPVDYIVFASLSALGFSFAENIGYFHGKHEIINSRALITVVSHMFDSSIIAFAIILAKFRGKGKLWPNIFAGYFIAMFTHGFYDFWLLNRYANNLHFITLAFMAITTLVWLFMINNSLNISLENSDESLIIKRKSFRNYLSGGLIFIVLYQYVLLAVENGAVSANYNFYDSMLYNGLFITFLSVSLSKFDVVPGFWSPFNFSNFYQKQEWSAIAGKEIKLTKTKNSKSPAIFPLTAKIVNRIVVEGDPDHYLIELNDSSFHGERIMIKRMRGRDVFEQDERIDVYLLKIDSDLINQNKIDTKGKVKLFEYCHAQLLN
ncbi:MAG: PrsW family intramembrane metalloprotease [Cytophagaceae bacterium]